MGLDKLLDILDLRDSFIISVKKTNYKFIFNSEQKNETYELISILKDSDEINMNNFSEFQKEIYNFFLKNGIYIDNNKENQINQKELYNLIGPKPFLHKYYTSYLKEESNWLLTNKELKNDLIQKVISVYIFEKYVLVSNDSVNIFGFKESNDSILLNEYAATVIYNFFKNPKNMNYLKSHIIKIDLTDFQNSYELIELNQITHLNFDKSIFFLEDFLEYSFEMNYQEYFPFVSIEIKNNFKKTKKIILGFDANDALNNTIKFILHNNEIDADPYFKNKLIAQNYISEILMGKDEVLNSFMEKILVAYFPMIETCTFSKSNVLLYDYRKKVVQVSKAEISYYLSHFVK